MICIMTSGARAAVESNADHGFALAASSSFDTKPAQPSSSDAVLACAAIHSSESGVAASTVYRGVRNTRGAPIQCGHAAAVASELSGKLGSGSGARRRGVAVGPGVVSGAWECRSGATSARSAVMAAKRAIPLRGSVLVGVAGMGQRGVQVVDDAARTVHTQDDRVSACVSDTRSAILHSRSMQR